MNNGKLKKDREFQIIYNFGKKEFGYYSLLFFKENKNSSEIRLGFVASKKTGNAVCRNRLRRLMREYFRLNSHLMKPGYDIVCVAKKKAGEKIDTLSYSDLEKDMNKVLKRAQLFIEGV